MSGKRNVVLYLDVEMVSKAREMGFNLYKTFENYLKMLINQFSNIYSRNNGENYVIGSPGEIRTPVDGSKARHSRDAYPSLLVHYSRRSLPLPG